MLGNLCEQGATYISSKCLRLKISLLCWCLRQMRAPVSSCNTLTAVRHLQTWCFCWLKKHGDSYCLRVAAGSGLSSCSRKEFSGSNLSLIWATMVLWISKKHPVTKISVSLNRHTSSKMFIVLSWSQSSFLSTLESFNNSVVHTLSRDRSDVGGEADLWGTHGNATFTESRAVGRASFPNFSYVKWQIMLKCAGSRIIVFQNSF